MEPEEFRQWGKAMVDYVADYWTTLRQREPLPRVEPGYLRSLMADEAPETGEPWEKIFKDLEPVVLQGMTHWHHPHFFAYYPTANSYPAVIGDILSTGVGCIGFTWNSSPSCTELEAVVMDWMAKMLKLPSEFLYTSDGKGAGMIQCTASDVTLVSLLAARSKALRGKLGMVNHVTEPDSIAPKLVAYTSDQAHSSVERAGLLANVKLRKLRTDETQSLSGQVLEDAIKEDMAQGLIPFCLVATLGTTSTCAFDNISELGPVCQRFQIWMHIDAAYAGSAFICPEYRHLLDGVEFADTFNFNAHKWLQVNFDCSLVWFKNTDDIEHAFLVDPLYLKHDGQGKAPDFRHWQIPLGRRFRAIKLWFVLRAFGINKLQEQIRTHCKLAKQFEQLISSDARFEVVAPVTLGLVCFRLKGSNNETNERLLKSINDDHRIHLVASSVGDRHFLRFAVCSNLSTAEDINFAYDVISEIAGKIVAPPTKA